MLSIKQALRERVNPGMLQAENHTYDNTLLLYLPDARAADAFAREHGMTFRGVCEAPFAKYSDNDLAFVYEEDGDIRWFHLTRLTWEHALLKYFDKAQADEIITSMFKNNARIHATSVV